MLTLEMKKDLQSSTKLAILGNQRKKNKLNKLNVSLLTVGSFLQN